MKGGAFVAAVLVAVAFAGCLGQGPDPAPGGRQILDPSLREPLTDALYELLGHFEQRLTGSTGVELYVDYYRPDTPEGVTTPVILVYTPYQGADAEEVSPEGAEATGEALGSAAYWPWLVEYFVPRGYTVAFADVRGNHRAGGCIDQTGPGQWQDGYDYVEWLGTQPWSNGKVGMFGVSYDAETQFTTAMTAPPHLTTIVPIASVSNQYEWNFYQGVPYEGQPTTGFAGYFAGSAAPSTDAMDLPRYPEKVECQPEQFQTALDYSGDMTPFWKERDYRPMAKDIQASVLHVHGLADWNVRPINIDPLFNDIASEKRGIFGLWHHATPDRGDWETILHAWFDHWLLGLENGILDILPPVLIEDSQGTWHALDEFPLREPQWLELELSADGKLVTPGTAKTGELVIHDYLQEAVTGSGVGQQAATAQSLAADHPVAVDFAWLTTSDLHVVGRPEVVFTASSTEETTHWVAELRVDEDERCSYNYANRTYNQSICYNVGYQDTRHLAGLDQPGGVTPDEPYELTIQMFPQYDVIPASQTLRLVLTNNNGDIQQDTTQSINTIHVGEGKALLRLPVIPAPDPLPHDELPPIWPGYLE